ncbi:MAG TPA: tyrosine-protein phosphatase [Streptosporangiaceae bacterium]|nr:tyrosine-protein phosphatase [Streptosporangiaceae bacterium]
MTQLAGQPGQAGPEAPGAWDQQEIAGLTLAYGRRIELGGTLNLRDLGGYPAAGGGFVRWRTLLRSDALHKLDPAGLATLSELGLRTVVDLRTQLEAETAPSALDGLPVQLAHISILSGDMQSLPIELEAIYRYMITECGDAIGAAIKELCMEQATPALVHCSAGKDRTGVVIALVLAALGVPDQVIAADYALSSIYLDPDRTPAIGQVQASTGLGDDLTRQLMTSPPALILDTLAWVRAASGSVDGYLVEHGVDSDDLAELRAALIA